MADHIFSLHILTEILKHNKAKLFCSFINFSNGFDNIWRVGLWMKLLGHNINGKIFRIIYNMYKDTKSCVMHTGEQSSFFHCQCGVRQGKNLSPLLLGLFFKQHMRGSHCKGIKLNMPDNQIETYLKLLVLLYADDTVIFGTDAGSFQNNLDILYKYAQQWKLNINYNQTKILTFGVRNTVTMTLNLAIIVSKYFMNSNP